MHACRRWLLNVIPSASITTTKLLDRQKTRPSPFLLSTSTIFSFPYPSQMAAPAQSTSKLPFHPSFCEPDADTVLCSTDNTYFRVPSFVLRNTSGLFRTMFTLPPCKDIPRCEETIPVYEPDDILVPMLEMICGLPVPKWLDYQHLERVLGLAEKWDTPGPLTIIRAAITAPLFLTHPLRLYAIATHFEWEEVAQVAAAASLSLCIFDPVHADALSTIPTIYLDPLLVLHAQRRDLFRKAIDSPARFTAGNVDPFYCSSCNVPIDNTSWRALKARMYEVMDMNPSGSCFYSSGDVDSWIEAEKCWGAVCSTKSCGSLNYDKLATLRQIRGCIEQLPTTVGAIKCV